MAPINLLSSILFVSLCINFLRYSWFNPTQLSSSAEIVRDRKNSSIKGMFVFGSSLVDNGNNKFLKTLAKADYLPYGMDFPLGPSGRYTNGENIIDILGNLLDIPAFIPSFFNPATKENHTAVGVDCACGGSGILDETGSIAGGVLSLNEQIKKFEDVTLPQLQNQGKNFKEALSKYLFVIGSGGNDYTLNYFLNRSKSNVSVHEFTDNLTTTLSSQLKKLYSLGAKKFVLMSLYPLGCTPRSIAAQPKRKGCDKSLNDAALLFNANLESLVKGIRPQKPSPNFVMVNAYNIMQEIIRNPVLYGFSDATKPCCQVPSRREGGNGISCKKGGTTCEERNKHVYFDALHPTEAVNVELATKAFSSDSINDVYPFNIRKLAQI